jgi:probable phosphoglycerate mutase
MASELYLLRHGETEWSLSGRHTGTTDVPLTKSGEEEAHRLRAALQGVTFNQVFTSPRVRARRTCELAGLGNLAHVHEDLHEWNYGDYEGLLIDEILKRHPGWDVFKHGCPQGETPQQVSDRADRALKMISRIEGKVAIVSHGHFTRALAMRWVQLPITHGSVLDSSTASMNILGFSKNRGTPLIKLWNKVGTNT